MSAPSKQTKGVGSMKRQNKMKIQRRRRRKFFWLFAAAAVCALLFGEQVAVLYVLSTLAMCGLLIVVAFSNLEARDASVKRTLESSGKIAYPRQTDIAPRRVVNFSWVSAGPSGLGNRQLTNTLSTGLFWFCFWSCFCP
jgi:hypothetical protein